MAFAGLDRENFIVTHGRLSTFASSEFAERGFCSACGTPLTYRAVKSARISVTLGSLDDPNAVAPDSQLGAESQVQWLPAALSHSNVRVDAWLTRLNIADVGSRQHPDHET